MSDSRAAVLVTALEKDIAAAFKQGADRISNEAKALAPVLKTESRLRVPGQLRDAIGVRGPTVAEGHVHASVGVDESKAFYGGFQEAGYHRGGLAVPGKHFMRRAFDANKAPIAKDVADRVKKAIDKANQ